MAPEQLKGSEVTARSDIYALGLVLYELFTGKRPYDAKNVRQLLEMQESAHLPSMTSIAADIDPMVEKAIRRCLDPDPAKRPASALAVAMALPGGDPLAAALAAGETPSPELVASAGRQEGMPRRYAVLCLGGHRDLPGSGHRAAKPHRGGIQYAHGQSAGGAGEQGAGNGRGFRLRPKAGRFGRLAGRAGRLSDAPQQTAQTAQMGGVAGFRTFGCRGLPAKPGLLVAAPYGDIDASNPPPTSPGMVQVSLNAAGKLRWFSAIPSPDAPPLADPVEPGAVFRAAGLDPAKFTETAPKFAPLGAADELHAWKGPHPKIPNLDLTVEMASWKGRLTAVHVLNRWKGDAAGSAGSVGDVAGAGIVLLFMAASGVLAAILLARRNWKLGRIDRKGALRIGMARFFLGMAVWLGTVHAVPSSDMISLALASMANWLLFGAGFWLLYLALEPSVRAHWPHSIVTWNRILAGRWKDAQVGSHILIGAAVGAAVWTTAGLVDYFTGAGLGGFGGMAAAIGTRHWIACACRHSRRHRWAIGMAIFLRAHGAAATGEKRSDRSHSGGDVLHVFQQQRLHFVQLAGKNRGLPLHFRGAVAGAAALRPGDHRRRCFLHRYFRLHRAGRRLENVVRPCRPGDGGSARGNRHLSPSGARWDRAKRSTRRPVEAGPALAGRAAGDSWRRRWCESTCSACRSNATRASTPMPGS